MLCCRIYRSGREALSHHRNEAPYVEPMSLSARSKAFHGADIAAWIFEVDALNSGDLIKPKNHTTCLPMHFENVSQGALTKETLESIMAVRMTAYGSETATSKYVVQVRCPRQKPRFSSSLLEQGLL